MKEETEIDQELDQNDSEEQLSDKGTGNDQDSGNQTDKTPTDFIDFEGVKVPASSFEKIARERYKDAFEAKENREKWQTENTRKAQENAEKLRKAELYDRMIAEGRFNQSQPSNPYEAKKKQYIERKSKQFPDVDPRFFESQFEDIQELAEMKGRELVQPIYAESGEKFEKDFLAAHPKVVKGSQEYNEIAKLMGAGVDPERAYQTVFHDSILEERLKEQTEKAIKARDEEAKRKLKQSRTTSGANGTAPKSKNFSDRAWSIINSMNGAGN